jgi:hypothetical protein
MSAKLIFFDRIGDYATTKTIQIGATSMEENIIGNFNLYPNPALSQINLKTDSKIIGSTYTIYDKTGKRI